jgi:hypothetical protein
MHRFLSLHCLRLVGTGVRNGSFESKINKICDIRLNNGFSTAASTAPLASFNGGSPVPVTVLTEDEKSMQEAGNKSILNCTV